MCAFIGAWTQAQQYILLKNEYDLVFVKPLSLLCDVMRNYQVRGKTVSISTGSYRNVTVSMHRLKVGRKIYLLSRNSRMKIKLSSMKVNFSTFYGSNEYEIHFAWYTLRYDTVEVFLPGIVAHGRLNIHISQLSASR